MMTFHLKCANAFRRSDSTISIIFISFLFTLASISSGQLEPPSEPTSESTSEPSSTWAEPTSQPPSPTAIPSLEPSVDYPVDFSRVPRNPAPATDTKTKSFGNCICDLTLRCDPNCLCDPDCDVAQLLNLMTGSAKEVQGTDELVYCDQGSSATDIVFANSAEARFREVAGRDAVCIVRTNLPSDMSSFYRIPSPTTVDKHLKTAASPWPPSPTETRYKVGAHIPVIGMYSRPKPFARTKGLLRIPRAKGPDHACNFDSAARFDYPESTSCVISYENVTAQCGDPTSWLSIQRYQYELFADRLATSNAYVSIRVYDAENPSVQIADFVMTVSNLWKNLMGGTTPILADTPITTIVINDETNQITCTNMVSSANYQVKYNIDDEDTSGAALFFPELALYVRNYTLPLKQQQQQGQEQEKEDDDSTTVVEFVESARFTLEYNLLFRLPSATSSTVIPPRVGNPGYVAGSTVHAGLKVEEEGDRGKIAVRARRGGLSLPVGYRCSDKVFQPVQFMYDVQTSGCGVEVRESDLELLCSASTGTQAELENALTPHGADSFILDRLGKKADAEFSAINDWVSVAGMPLSQSETDKQYDSVGGRCDGLIVGLHWIIGVGRAGVNYNPQDLILGAKVEPIMGSWFHRGTNPDVPTLNHFEFKVTFVRIPDDADLERPTIVPPNVLPEVDEDVFFPFRTATEPVQDVQNY